MKNYVIPSKDLRKILSLSKPVMSIPLQIKSMTSLRISSTGATVVHPGASLVVPMKLPPIDLVLSEKTVGTLLRLMDGYDGDITVIDDPSYFTLTFGYLKVSHPKGVKEILAIEFPTGLNLVPCPPSLLSDLKIVEFAGGDDTRIPNLFGVWLMDGKYYACDNYGAFLKTIPIKWELSAPLFLSFRILPMMHSLKLTPAKVGVDDDGETWIVFEEGVFLRLPIVSSQKPKAPPVQKLFLPESLGKEEVDISSWKDSSDDLKRLQGVIPKKDPVRVTITKNMMELDYPGVDKASTNSKIKIASAIPVKVKGKAPVKFIVQSDKFFEGLSRFSRFIVYSKGIRFLDGSPDEDYIIPSARSKASND
jgi:hypothetical protein